MNRILAEMLVKLTDPNGTSKVYTGLVRGVEIERTNRGQRQNITIERPDDPNKWPYIRSRELLPGDTVPRLAEGDQVAFSASKYTRGCILVTPAYSLSYTRVVLIKKSQT